MNLKTIGKLVGLGAALAVLALAAGNQGQVGIAQQGCTVTTQGIWELARDTSLQQLWVPSSDIVVVATVTNSSQDTAILKIDDKEIALSGGSTVVARGKNVAVRRERSTGTYDCPNRSCDGRSFTALNFRWPTFIIGSAFINSGGFRIGSIIIYKNNEIVAQDGYRVSFAGFATQVVFNLPTGWVSYGWDFLLGLPKGSYTLAIPLP